MRFLIILVLWQISVIAYAVDMDRGRPSGGLELKALPELCQVRFTTGFVGQNVKWRTILGKDFMHVHHYCMGILYLNRSDRRDKHRKAYLRGAQSNFEYTIQHLINPKYVLLPDIYYQMGIVAKKLKKIDDAIGYAKKSIQSRKKYLKSYLLLADLYIKGGSMDQAEEILLEAKKYYPKSKGIKRRLKKIK